VTNAESWLTRFGQCRVLVVGDLMLDDYRHGHVERISPEAPVPILRVEASEILLGGAGNVVRNLRSLNVGVDVIGVLGDDETGRQVLQELADLGVDPSGVVRDPQRISTRKIRYVSAEHGQQVFRADQESVQPVNGHLEEELVKIFGHKAQSANVILCSDYLKGVLTERVLSAVFTVACYRKVPSIVAPKDGHARKYRGASVLVPNLKELTRLVGNLVGGDAWLAETARCLTEALGLEALLVTRGRDGMSLFEMADGGLRQLDIPTVARNVFDVTGAGDTAIAAFAAAVASGADRETAAHLANAAAGIVVGKRGTATVTLDELQDHLIEQELHAPRGYEQRTACQVKRAGGTSNV